MKVAIFGATGRTGTQLVMKALEQGHEVTAVARNPLGLTLQHERLKVVAGNITDPASIEKAIAGQDVVLSAVGAPLSRQPTTIHEDSARNILRAMEKQGLRRFVCISSGGTNPKHDPNLPFVFEKVFKRLFFNIYQDQMNMEAVITDSPLDWMIVRPPQLTDGAPTGSYRTGLAYALPGGNKVARADLADFMVKHLNDPQYYRKAVAIAY